jgi:hypothetical protein
MEITFLDKEERANPLNGQRIHSSQELERNFDQLRYRAPFGLELVGENGFSLDICLAESYGSVQHTASDGDSAYFLAVAPGNPSNHTPGDVSPHTVADRADHENGVQSPEFLVGGTATPIPTRYILPYDLVKIIAVHFLETGEREPNVLWEEI